MSHDLESTARSLVATGNGILAANETLPKRFDTLGIPSTEQTQRTYREMLFTARDGDKSHRSGCHDD